MIFSSTKKFEKQMAQAESYAEWSKAAKNYDAAAGYDRWKIMDQSRRFDYVSIRVRLDRLRALRARHDNHGLLLNLNEGIHGNVDGMGKRELYQKAKFGTKQLVCDYVDEIVSALEHLADPKVNDISFEEKLDFFRRAHHCFGSTALMMSGSGSLLYFHVGVIRTLFKERLLPNIFSGSSGGSIVGSAVCTKSDDEIESTFDIENILFERESRTGLFSLLDNIAPKPLDQEQIKEQIKKLIPDLTFQEAHAKTGRHMNIPIAPAEHHQTSRLLNAFTSPNVMMRESILASSAVPGVYPPVTLMARSPQGERIAYLPSRKWVDGSVSDDLPAKRLARLYGANHYIVSQTNPHVVPFVNDNKRNSDVSAILRHATQNTIREWINAGAEILRRPIKHNHTMNRLINMTISVINQDYIGDINILPPTGVVNPFKVLATRTEKEIKKMILLGERSTWPKIEMIRVQTKIGRTLDRILSDYEEHYIDLIEKRSTNTKEMSAKVSSKKSGLKAV
ncbi:MAG: patatin [Gammaproteobacteria bacterium]|nr:MAG: patatin [Gammaproteobacteria bacterium]